VVLSWVFLAEVPSAQVLAGGSLCLAGISVSQLPTGQCAVSAEAAADGSTPIVPPLIQLSVAFDPEPGSPPPDP
jgi:hypothetical protein